MSAPDPRGERGGPPEDLSDPDSDRWFDVERTVAFSDAVIAVAITLLVVALEVPDVEEAELGDALSDLTPTLVAFAISFWLIAAFWMDHHRFGRRLKAIDTGLMRINLLFLAGISLISFGTGLFDRYAGNPIATTFYTLILVSVGGTMNWLWRYAIRHDLLIATPPSRDVDPKVTVVRTVIYLLAIPLSLVTPWAPLIWVLNFRAGTIAGLLMGLRGRPRERAATESPPAPDRDRARRR